MVRLLNGTRRIVLLKRPRNVIAETHMYKVSIWVPNNVLGPELSIRTQNRPYGPRNKNIFMFWAVK